MAAGKRIAFVNPPRVKEGFIEAEDCCWGASSKLVLPAMLLSCASQIKDAIFIDLAIDNLNDLKILSPDIIVIPLAWQYHRETYNTMAQFCSQNGIQLVVIAVPPGYVQDYAMLEPNPHMVVYSEPETVFKDWADHEFSDEWKYDPANSGIAYYSSGIVTLRGIRDCEFDKIGRTNYAWLVHPHYRDRYRVAVVQATRGCPYRCHFCVWGGSTITDKSFKMRNPKVVADDLKAVWKILNQKFIYLLSAQLTTNLDWIKEFHKNMVGSGVQFQSNVRINEVTDEKLKLLSESGMTNTSVGVEALTDKLLLRLKKGYDMETVKKGLVIMDNSGIPYHVHLRLGYGETVEEIAEVHKSLDELAKLNLKNMRADLGPLIFYKGTVYGDNHPCESVPSPNYTENCPMMKGIPREWNAIGQRLIEMGWIG
ncbi:radical SAM protein [Sulfuricurvum sp.]|uniref:B12-binding domain-containing radical SAM protein n=1 Tax=Sulfuricurvum sp. TaxID=2025608 RepID=UPI003564E5D4